MNPSLARIDAFVHTAENKSFREAARQLGVTPTAVSKAVAALEDELGIRLLNRTTRHVAVTPEGEVYLRHCREALDRLSAGRDLVMRQARVAKGRLKVSMSFVLGRPIVARIGRLLDRYPGLQVYLSFSDTMSNLVEDEADVALRIGELADTNLVGRVIRTTRWVTVASPNYLARFGTPDSPQALGAHTCVQFARPTGQVAPWQFRSDPQPFVAPAPVLFDHGDLMVDAAAAGLGITQVFDFMVEGPIARGDVQEILADRSVPGPPIHALSLPGRQRVPRIRAFLDFASEVLGA